MTFSSRVRRMLVPILIYFHLLSGGKERSEVAMPSASNPAPHTLR